MITYSLIVLIHIVPLLNKEVKYNYWLSEFRYTFLISTSFPLILALNKRGENIWLHMATYTLISFLNHHANIIDSLFALICSILDIKFIDYEVRFDISRLGLLEFFASLNKFKYSCVIEFTDKCTKTLIKIKDDM